MARQPAKFLCRLAVGSALSLSTWTALAEEAPRPAPATRINLFDPDEGQAIAEDFGAPEAAQPDDSVAPAEIDAGIDVDGAGFRTEVITERYPNRSVRIERHVAQDAEGNYFNHGAWSHWNEKGVLRGTGEYRNGLRHGKWVRWFDAGEGKIFQAPLYKQFQPPFVAEANFVDDKLDGVWTIMDSRGRKASEWEFENGELNGLSTWYFPGGPKQREVTYQNGQIEGTVLEWTLTTAGKSQRGQAPAELIHNLVTRAVFVDGRRQGPHVEYYSPGKKKVEGWYLLAKEISKSEYDFWNGAIETKVIGKEGVNQRTGLWTWYYADGGKQLEGEFEAGEPVGLHTWWHPNGQKQSEGRFEKGLEIGKWVWWHANGQKQAEGEYTAGAQTGHWTRWNEIGKVVEVQDFSAAGFVPPAEMQEVPARPLPQEEPNITAIPQRPTLSPQPHSIRQPTPFRVEASRRTRGTRRF